MEPLGGAVVALAMTKALKEAFEVASLSPHEG
jgi:hypothetical protein